MIFDITMIGETQESLQYRPRNRAYCKGILLYRGEEVASLKSLSLCYVRDPLCLLGRFELEWYRQDKDIEFFTGNLDIYIEYGEGKPLVGMIGWRLSDVMILEDGVSVAIASLKELISKENIFSAMHLEVTHFVENMGAAQIKDTFGYDFPPPGSTL